MRDVGIYRSGRLASVSKGILQKSCNIGFISIEIFLMIVRMGIDNKLLCQLQIFFLFNLTFILPDRRQVDYIIDMALRKALLCHRLYSCKQNRELWSACGDFVR